MKMKDIKINKSFLYVSLINGVYHSQFRTFRITIREMNKLINNIVNEKCMCVNFVTRIKIEI